MPRMFPEVFLRTEPQYEAERRVFTLLCDRLPDDCTVIHDCSWMLIPALRPQQVPQIDFVVCLPSIGIITVEVKGGVRIWRDKGMWYGQTRGGHTFPYKRPPHEQARDGAMSLARLMQTTTPGFPAYRIVHAVCFPDVDVPSESLDATLDRAIVIDRGDLADIPSAFARVSDYWRAHGHLRPPHRGPAVTAEMERALIDTLARNVTFAQLLQRTIEIERKAVTAISEEQAAALLASRDTHRYSVAGCAGSGKTLLALTLARKLASEGCDTLICCVSRPLCDYLDKLTRDEPLIRVATLHSIAGELRVVISGRTDDLREDRLEATLDDLAKRMPTAHPRWRRVDAIIVDEGQDIPRAGWEVLEYVGHRPGEQPFIVFYDDNQAVFRAPDGLPSVTHTLTRSFRTTREIHQEVLGLYRNPAVIPLSSERPGVKPRFATYEPNWPGGLRMALDRILTQLRADGVRDQDIVVLTPRAQSDSELWVIGPELGLDSNDTLPNGIRWDTIRRFKGLESPVVIVVEVESDIIGHPQSEALLYIAYSRPTTALYVLYAANVDEADVRPRLRQRVLSPLLQGLDRYQRRAVEAGVGRALVRAGAGSGKTRVLTRRIAYLSDHYGLAPEQILAVTFTRKASREMRTRLERLLGVQRTSKLLIGTFHHLCSKILRSEIPRLPDQRFLGRTTGMVILDEQDSKALCREITQVTTIPPDALRAFIARNKREGTLPGEWTEAPENDREQKLRECYWHYEERLKQQDAADYDDLLLLAVKLLKGHPQARLRLRRRFRAILVDEYQDTNAIQLDLIRLLATDDNGMPLEGHSLFAVGDAAQSIYGWRGADYQIFLNFSKHFPDAETFELRRNYRSVIPIVEVAQTIADRSFTGVDRLDVEADRRDLAPEALVWESQTTEEEAEQVGGYIENLVRRRKIPPREIAVLFRVLRGRSAATAAIKALEEQLFRRHIPYHTHGLQAFYRSEIVRSMLVVLRAIVAPQDDSRVLDLLSLRLAPGIGPATLERLKAAPAILGVRTIWEVLTLEREIGLPGMRGTERLSTTRSDIGIPGERRGVLMSVGEALTELHRMYRSDSSVINLITNARAKLNFDIFYQKDDTADQFHGLLNILARTLTQEMEQREADLAETLASFALLETADDDSATEADDGGRVSLMSIHRAKGLEFYAVIVPGMEEGVLPSERRGNDDDEDGSGPSVLGPSARAALLEEGRVCYVALTRARDELVLSYVAYRDGDLKAEPAKPSRYLEAVRRVLVSRAEAAEIDEIYQLLDEERGLPPPADDAAEQDDIVLFWREPAVIEVDFSAGVWTEEMLRQLEQLSLRYHGEHPLRVVLPGDDGPEILDGFGVSVLGDARSLSVYRQVTGAAVRRIPQPLSSSPAEELL